MIMPHAKEPAFLSLFSSLSNLLSQPNALEIQLDQVLPLLASELPIRNGFLTLFNRETGEIYIEKAHGLSKQQQSKGRYKLGEGIIGAVVESGKTLIVPDIRKEPRFLSRTHARNTQERLSFICVPIEYHREVLGTLSAEEFYESDAALEEDARVLAVAAFMISELVNIHRLEHEKGYEENLRLKNENLQLKEALTQEFHPPNILGNSSVMRDVYALIHKVAATHATVLILGESGVGKELVTDAIHHLSERKDQPLVKFNCAALPESIIENELFGHEAGAFTGAATARPGRFEIADNGTVFLDEIGEISPLVQTKLLRVLQEREIERLGGNRPRKINVRIIAATNKNLEELIRQGRFREDLYYRLNVFPIPVPPLRERKTDIPLLTDYFIEKYSKRLNVPVKRISTPAIDMFMSYHWPGNVRELQNCIERAVLLCEDGVIRSTHLPPTLQSSVSSGTAYTGTLEETVNQLEKEMIIESLKETKGNMAQSARALGLTERMMGLRVNKYTIDSRRYRPSRLTTK
jgi:Nif-specific regulatory protein